jgi:heat-inducible transcriptional repressor
MAVLEAEGYIAQPHTSSGRIPTEKGYREFVDRLDDVKPMSAGERRAILSFLESGVDLDDVLRRAVRLLAQLTRQVAIIQYPTLSTSTVRHLEVVPLTRPSCCWWSSWTPAGSISGWSSWATPSTNTNCPSCGSASARPWRASRCRLPRSRSPTLASAFDGRGGLGDALGRAATVLVETLVEHSEERLVSAAPPT